MIKYLLLLCLCLTSCAGYQLGGAKPTPLSHVKRVNVPLFDNSTLLIRAESYATNSAVDAIHRDGTYLVSNLDNSDAILKGRISDVKYGQVSSSRIDSLLASELSMTITLSWQLVDAKNPLKQLAAGRSTGRTKFFAEGNLHTARTNALPDALRRASEAMVSKIADGF